MDSGGGSWSFWCTQLIYPVYIVMGRMVKKPRLEGLVYPEYVFYVAIDMVFVFMVSCLFGYVFMF